MVVSLCAAGARADVNPAFTPRHLVDQSEWIARVELSAQPKSNVMTARVTAKLKGKPPAAAMAIDLSQAISEAQREFAQRHIAAAGRPTGLLFAGAYKWEWPDQEEDLPPHKPERKGLLYVQAKEWGCWLELLPPARKDDKHQWEFDQLDHGMHDIWYGGAEMLERAVRYLLKSPTNRLPIESGCAGWATILKVGPIDGRCSLASPVDIAAKGELSLFVANDRGDRLYRFDAANKKLEDVTARHKLTSRSLAAAWGDFDANGRVDLAGWDGTALRFHLQDADSRLRPGPHVAAAGLGGGVIGLATVGSPRAGRAGVLVSTAGRPLRLALGARRAVSVEPLPEAAPSKRKPLGKAGACLAADFDNDGLADVLQPFAKGSLLYRGKAGGRFAPPVPCEVHLEKAGSAAWLGDYEGEGLLDVFVASEGYPLLWRNLGGGRFAECFRQSGPIRYLAKPGSNGGQTDDFNNDGRQDTVVLYGDKLFPGLFFNRGVRSLSLAYDLDLYNARFTKTPGVPPEEGQQAGCMADLNHDGEQDMALVMNSGQLWVCLQNPPAKPRPTVTVALALGRGPVGPITVIGHAKHRCLGAWSVVAGASQARFGLGGPGSMTIQWRGPDGKKRQRQITLKDRSSRMLIRDE
jgi:hypothetical protein